MKNVAGYDAARLMVGAQGTLGLLLDISIKVLPINESEISLKIHTDLNNAINTLQQFVRQGMPLTASCHIDGTLTIRLSSTPSAVKQSIDVINKKLDTEEIDETFWLTIKNQTHDFFSSDKLWRCSHQPSTEIYGDKDKQLIEWNGALRWIKSDENLFATAEKHNGHTSRYPLTQNKNQINDIFQPLQPGILKIHQRLKRAFDPENILNPGRMYTNL